MSCDTICTFLQPIVDSIQAVLNLVYLPYTLLGIVAPPVDTWFQPFVTCTLT
jgi:hypothetical protein